MSKDFLYPLRRLHGWLHEWPTNHREKKELIKTYINPVKQQLRSHPKTVFLVLTPAHSNLGDHAIALAETTMLNKHNIPFIEITGEKLALLKKHRLLGFMNGQPILINGGGNMGTLWYSAERSHRAVILSNPKSPIFILPNTIFYEESDWGSRELEESIRIYNHHPKLQLYAREKESFQSMIRYYRNVTLTPDMVLSLNYSNIARSRNGCLLCLRNDLERTLNDEEWSQLIDQVRTLFCDSFTFTDTCVGHPIASEQRKHELERKFTEFQSSELVITDRLHGMIFSAITGTPCIVVNSKSPKVKGCYEWIKHLDYIKFADDVTQIVQLYHQIPAGEHHYDNSGLQHYYRKLENDILNTIRQKKE